MKKIKTEELDVSKTYLIKVPNNYTILEIQNMVYELALKGIKAIAIREECSLTEFDKSKDYILEVPEDIRQAYLKSYEEYLKNLGVKFVVKPSNCNLISKEKTC